jgi:hypothetical protein
MLPWDRDQWDEYDRTIDIAFHARDVFFTPLLNYVAMVPGANNWILGRELLGTHVNHETIGNRQRYINAMYVDSREKRLTSDGRYGGKVQIHKFDQLVSRFESNPPMFMLQVLRNRLAQGIVETHEKIARDATFDFAEFQFTADGTLFAAGTNDFSDMTATATYQFDIRFVNEIRLRMLERARKWTQRYGSWASPIPGAQYQNDLMIMCTPNHMYDVWTSDEGAWLEDLRQLQDERIINGGVARYRGATFVENPWLVLRNAGPLTTQVAVTAQIDWGDGAPDPGDAGSGTFVDNVYLVGQSSANVTHFIQCSAFVAADFSVGDVVSIHTTRTAAYGVTNGVDFLHGKTYEAEIVTVDAANNRLTISEPMTEEYIESFNDATFGQIYAYVTLARDIHPVVIVGARGYATFASRSKVGLYNPPDVADLPGVHRFTWDEYGSPNRWNPYVYEIIFTVASDTRGGRDEVSLR